MFTVTPGNKTLLHTQVALQLEQRLQRGLYPSDQPFPSYRELCSEFGVSLGVIQRAVNELAGRGLLTVHPGKGISIPPQSRAARVGIPFGLIEPFAPGQAFDLSMALHAEQVFSERDNFLVLRSSHGSPIREREIAQQMVRNGVQGLMIWPVQNNPNGIVFEELAKQVPVVLVDSLIEGVDLPAVVHDFYRLGQQIVEQAFKVEGRRRLLVLLDDLKISTYRDMVNGLRDQSIALNRMSDLTVLQLPISQFIGQLKRSNVEMLADHMQAVRRALSEQNYDAVFCFQDEFLDAVLIDTDMYREFPSLRMMAACNVRVNNRMPKYLAAGVMQWGLDYPGMVMMAADRLQQAVISHNLTPGVHKLEIKLVAKAGAASGNHIQAV